MKNVVHNKDKKHIISMAVVLISAVLLMLIAPLIWGKSDLGFHKEAVYELKEWHIGGLDGEIITLPNTIPTDKGQTVTITSKLSLEQRGQKSICLRTSQQQVDIYFDGVLKPLDEVYSKRQLGKSKGSNWILVDLPEKEWNGVVSISFTSPYKTTSGKINSITYGYRSDLLLHIVKMSSYSLFIALLGYLSGMICIIQCYLARREKKQYERLLYLGVFDLVSSTWILSESKLLQFVCRDQFTLSNLSYLTLLLLPIPFIYYMNSSYESHQRVKYGFFSMLFYINYIVVLSLQLFEVKDFFETLQSVHILILVSSILIIISLIVEVKKYKNEDAKAMLLPNLILIGSGILELTNFYFSGLTRVSMYFETGLFIFMLMNGYYSIQGLNQFKQAQMEARIYEKLAFKDPLTGGKNRNAYEVEIGKQMQTINQNTWLVMFDANNLKKINDSFGHAYGDKMLNKMYLAIIDCFGEHGTCYRIGGDEFALLYQESEAGECVRRVKQFIEKMDLQKDQSIAYDTAIGYAQYDKRLHDSFHKLEMEADYRMYQDKLRRKAQQGSI